MFQITQNTSHKEIADKISNLREQKGKEKETLLLIEKALNYGHDFVINLLWEQALTYQHLVMNEDAKGENADRSIRAVNLKKMADVVGLAKFYVEAFSLNQWKSRMYLFLGKVDDYKGNHLRAVKNYSSSVKYAKLDPEFVENKIPKYLEIEGHLSFSMIMSGKVEAGYDLAKKTYQKFVTDKNAVELKKKDYLTWAIWRTGIPIRTTKALVEKKSAVNIVILKNWLNEAEKLLAPKEQFTYRLAEIKVLKRSIVKN